MEKRYVAITAIPFCKTDERPFCLRPGMRLKLKKDDEFEEEGIKAFAEGLGPVGYVANSSATVPKGCRSAGRIYDSFGNMIDAVVRFAFNETVIAELIEYEQEHDEQIMIIFSMIEDFFDEGRR